MTRLEDSCVVTYTKNDDGSSSYTVTMNPVGTKCMEVLCAEPGEYLCNLLNVRVKKEGERLVKTTIDKLIQEDRVEEMKSTEETILSYEKPVYTPNIM